MLRHVPLRESLRLAVPLILSNLTVPLLGIVDSAVVGRLPEPYYLGAVALGAAAMNIVLWVFGFLRTATGGLTAQAHGAEHGVEIKATFVRAGFFAIVIGLIILLASPLAVGFAELIFAPDGPLRDAMRAYLGIRLLGAPAVLVAHAIIGWFLGQQNPRVPLIMLVAANGLNAVLDIVLVFGFGLGVEGVAIATVIADYTALAIGIVFVLKRWPQLIAIRLRLADIVVASRLQQFFGLARDIFLRTCMLQAGFLMFISLSVRQGDVVLAANAVLLNFFMLQAHGLDGFADAAEAMSGKAVGRRRPDELQAAVLAGIVNALVLATLMMVGFALAGGVIVDLITTIESVRHEARGFLGYIAVLPLISAWAFVFDGVFFGATRGREMRNAMIVALAAYVLLAFTFEYAWGNHGLWIALLLFMSMRGLTLATIYWRADRGAAFVRPR